MVYKKSLASFILIILLSCLLGCQYNLQKNAEANGFTHEIVSTPSFKIATAQRFIHSKSHSKLLKVYIEGDGRAWLNRHTPSNNPTPKNPLTFKLANLDQNQSVLYIARPCQFTKEDPLCHKAYWTHARYSKKVVESINSVINQIMVQEKFEACELVGFSGGAAIALIIATKRNDVKKVVTVAGNIDIETFVNIHQLTPMADSINPTSLSSKLKGIPQVHFVGSKDKIVPKVIAEQYVAKVKPAHARVSTQVATHMKGWEELWPQLIKNLAADNMDKNN